MSDAVLASFLTSAELAQVQEASSFVDEFPLHNDEGYTQRNLMLQNRVNQLRLNLEFIQSKCQSELKMWEASLREDNSRFFKTASERTIMCHSDPKWRDLNERLTKVVLSVKRLESIEWMLRNALQVSKNR